MKKPTEWEQDYQDCLHGYHGDWWRLRAERAGEQRDSYWRRWQEIRVFETPPEEGYLRLIT